MTDTDLKAITDRLDRIEAACYVQGILKRPVAPPPPRPRTTATKSLWSFMDGSWGVTFWYICPCGSKHEAQEIVPRHALNNGSYYPTFSAKCGKTVDVLLVKEN